MAKKKSTKEQITVLFGPDPQTGRRLKKPKTVDARLEQLVKENKAWIRLVKECWFDPGDPLIEHAIGATELPELPATYEEAITSIQHLIAYAEAAEEKLQKGKREAERKLNEAKE